MIPIEDIVTNPNNFYGIRDIEVLIEDIKTNGLYTNLVVKPLGDKFEIISGERRYTACKAIHDEDDSKYKFISCKVFIGNDRDAAVMLIQANATTRELTPSEKLQQIQKMLDLYEEKKKFGEYFSGSMKDKLAKDLQMGTTQIAKYQTINANLNDEEKQNFIEGNMSVNEAVDLAKKNKDKDKPKDSTAQPNKPKAKTKFTYQCGCDYIITSKNEVSCKCNECGEQFEEI